MILPTSSTTSSAEHLRTKFVPLRALPRSWYERSTLAVARELLGCIIVRDHHHTHILARITETEAYHGFSDTASHAHRGETARNTIMFGAPGHAYIYLVYGMYHCLNIVTGPQRFPAAVLIRGVEILSPKRTVKARTNGPGKLTRVLHISREQNSTDITTPGPLWIMRGTLQSNERITRHPRIGIDYASAAYRAKRWRFTLTQNAPRASNPEVSRRATARNRVLRRLR